MTHRNNDDLTVLTVVQRDTLNVIGEFISEHLCNAVASAFDGELHLDMDDMVEYNSHEWQFNTRVSLLDAPGDEKTPVRTLDTQVRASVDTKTRTATYHMTYTLNDGRATYDDITQTASYSCQDLETLQDALNDLLFDMEDTWVRLIDVDAHAVSESMEHSLKLATDNNDHPSDDISFTVTEVTTGNDDADELPNLFEDDGTITPAARQFIRGEAFVHRLGPKLMTRLRDATRAIEWFNLFTHNGSQPAVSLMFQHKVDSARETMYPLITVEFLVERVTDAGITVNVTVRPLKTDGEPQVMHHFGQPSEGHTASPDPYLHLITSKRLNLVLVPDQIHVSDAQIDAVIQAMMEGIARIQPSLEIIMGAITEAMNSNSEDWGAIHARMKAHMKQHMEQQDETTEDDEQEEQESFDPEAHPKIVDIFNHPSFRKHNTDKE